MPGTKCQASPGTTNRPYSSSEKAAMGRQAVDIKTAWKEVCTQLQINVGKWHLRSQALAGRIVPIAPILCMAP